MRYLVALIIGIGALFGINAFADLFSMPRPWGSLLMGATVGITMVVVLLIWEVVKPSNKDTAPAKPAMSEEERANARAERRARLAAEAGVSLDDNGEPEEEADSKTSSPGKTAVPGATAVPETKTTDGSVPETAPPMESAAEDDTSPGADESSFEAEPAVAQSTDAEPNLEEPETLAPDEFNEEATGSSLESPPTGEPGVSVDSLEDAESETAEGNGESGDDESAEAAESSDDDGAGEETIPGGPTPKS
ncbi:hypothetical protein [Brevibacterium zhoupengii]|uniref:hypothetical protein n=1 Tax=Brevibacterium zhoupengii TaxID=2898795 RepID=UPI001E28F4CD|nr:hypothetical protein [Brevibacterium zhoupengii]